MSQNDWRMHDQMLFYATCDHPIFENYWPGKVKVKLYEYRVETCAIKGYFMMIKETRSRNGEGGPAKMTLLFYKYMSL